MIDYNTEFKPDDRYAPTPYRSSDHDPVLVGLGLTPVPPVVSVSDAPAVVEGGDLLFTLTLSEARDVQSVRVTSSGPAEHAAVSERVFFAAGATTATVRVRTTPDLVDEDDESVTLTLSYPTGAALGDATGSGTVYDDDTSTVVVTGSAVLEGDRGTTSLPFTVLLSTPSERPVVVAYLTRDGTASAGCDYTAVAGTVTLAPGSTSATVAVPVLGDRDREPDETVRLVVSSGASATGTILTDDGPAKRAVC